MAKSFGWAGEILWVDLSDRKITRVPTSDFEPRKYIGGVGLSTKIFWEMGSPEVEAYHPTSPLIISAGPLTGVGGPFNRAEVCGIAPQSHPEELFRSLPAPCISRMCLGQRRAARGENRILLSHLQPARPLRRRWSLYHFHKLM